MKYRDMLKAKQQPNQPPVQVPDEVVKEALAWLEKLDVEGFDLQPGTQRIPFEPSTLAS